MATALITGSSGLVGSACVRHFHALGWEVHGIDSGARAEYFGPDGDVRGARDRLREECPGAVLWGCDVRDPAFVADVVKMARPDMIVHAAAQPSHDYAADHVAKDFEVNAGGTLNLLEAAREYAPATAFVFMSTNKVYGDAPNLWPLIERPTRFECAWGGGWPGFEDWPGFGETLEIDQSTHSLFGCSKLAADLYVQEYGRYFGMNTVCFRAGCLTGGAHAGAERHGFLAYLARCCKEGRPYRVYGYKGKQVRDQLHAADVASACGEFYKSPRKGAVYNLGGGRDNSVSVLEAIALVEKATGKSLAWECVDEARKGDHICWITDTSKFRRDYPGWRVTKSLRDIIKELAGDV